MPVLTEYNMAPTEGNSKFSTGLTMRPWSSNPELAAKRKEGKKFTLFVCFRSNIRKDHWEPDSDHPICYGCQRKFKTFFRRHHCRRCGKVFCYICSGLKSRLDENAEIGSEGHYHRVCFFCYKSRDACIFNEQSLGQITSLSNTFRKMRDKESLRTSLSLTDMFRHQFNAEVAELCDPVLELFMKKKSSGGLVKPVKFVGNAIRKAGRESICKKCSNNILVPKNRKICMLCTEEDVYCKKCSSKRLVLFSDGSSRNVGLPDVVLTDSFEEFAQKYANCEAYRTCLDCEVKVKTVLDRAHFDKNLDSIHRVMCQIQFDISEALKQQESGTTSRSLQSVEDENRDSGIEMNGFPDGKHGDDLDESFDLMTEREIMLEGSKISTNLINKLFNKYQELTRLNSALHPTTPTRIKLINNVKQAMHAYYFQTKRKILKPTAQDMATTQI